MNFVSILLYKSVIGKGYAEIFYKMNIYLKNIYIFDNVPCLCRSEKIYTKRFMSNYTNCNNILLYINHYYIIIQFWKGKY